MSNSLVTINLVVLNGEKYIQHCLDGVLAQTYPKKLIELNILDNGSTDQTKEIIKSTRSDLEARTDLNGSLAKFDLIELTKNVGVWPGQEKLLQYSGGKYVLGLCVDVLLDKDFIKNAVEVMERDDKIGALQAKIYKYELTSLPAYQLTSLPAKIIDTCGFKIERSRRMTNIGHGEPDFAKATTGKKDNNSMFDFNKQQGIFGVEGACPFFRRNAIESCRISLPTYRLTNLSATTEIFDHDYFWYGDDLDLAWRMNLFGWKQIFTPTVIAWHDRQTTKGLRKNWLDYILRVPVRHQIPLKKRRLDWRNTRWTIIKNDYIINILKDSPFIIAREVAVFGYTLLFEPKVFLEAGNFFRLLPKMLRKRREIMKKAVKKSEEIHKYFQ